MRQVVVRRGFVFEGTNVIRISRVPRIDFRIQRIDGGRRIHVGIRCRRIGILTYFKSSQFQVGYGTIEIVGGKGGESIITRISNNSTGHQVSCHRTFTHARICRNIKDISYYSTGNTRGTDIAMINTCQNRLCFLYIAHNSSCIRGIAVGCNVTIVLASDDGT